VVVSGRHADRLEAAERSLRDLGGEVCAIAADATDDTQVRALINGAIERFGRLDALINNVGQSSRSRVLDATPEQLLQSIELNLLSAVRCTRAAAPHLLESRGHLVNIGSLASKTASPYLTLYSAGKFALAAYTHQLRLELGPQGLHVLLVCPGPILRDDSGERYAEQSRDLPEPAQQPGGGTTLKGVDPRWLAERILRACERRKPELIVPAKSRLLFILSAISPKLGDWLLRKFVKS
jgi:short-subunit dehydrogenase